MGSFGECYCGPPDCCLANADYPNWDNGGQPGSCCRVCEFAIVDDPWTLVCSDPIRTDTRSASAEYKYYTTPFPVVTGAMPTWPPCLTAKTLCATIQETHEVVVVERLMLRYRKIRQDSSITRIEIKCGAEETRVCRWVVSSVVCFDVEYGQVEFRSEDHVRTGTGSSCCSIAGALLDYHVAMPTCAARAALGFPTTSTVCIKRIKIYDTEPTGTITFSDGDWVDCEDLGVCIRDGVKDFCLVSIDGGNAPWTAPYCYHYNATTPRIVIQYTNDTCCDEMPEFADGLFVGQTQLSLCTGPLGNCDCLYTWNGTDWVLTSTTCNYTPETICKVWYPALTCAVILASVLPGPNGLLSVPGIVYSCSITCGLDTPADKYISEVNCTLLSTPYHPTPTYTERQICLPVLPPWTVNLGACP